MKKEKIKLSIIMGFIGIVILSIGVSYSIYQSGMKDKNIQIMTTGKAKVEISNEVVPTFAELIPLTDEEGLNETDNSYSFTISNVGDTKINYKLYLIDNQIDGAEMLSDEYIKTSVVINGKNMGIKRLSEVNEAINNSENTGRLLNDKDLTISKESEDNFSDDYVIKIWLDNERIENMSDAERLELDDKVVSLKLKVVATQVFDINAEYVPPEIGISIDNVTTNSFRITAGTDPSSDSEKIESYEFSCDGETPVVSPNNTYTCNNVKTGLHKFVQARAKDIKKSYIYSNKGEVSIPKLGEITMASSNAGWATSKTITITYPENINNFTYQYKVNNGGWQTVSGEAVDVSLTSNGSVIARVSDGTNTVMKEHIEDKIDTEKPVCTWSGPYTTATGTTALTYLKAGGVGYYQLNCSDASALTINESEIGLSNTNASIVKYSQSGNRFVYKVTAGSSSGVVKAKVMEGFATDQVGLRNVESTSTNGITIDTVAPTCGIVTGGSTTWTNSNRKISVVCNDTGGSNCTQPSYENTYSSNATTANITIRDNAGNTANCPVNVYIDKQGPTISNGTISYTPTQNSLSLSWTKATDNSTAQANINYYVCKSTTNNLNDSNCKTTYLVGSGKNISSYNIASLNPGTKYYVKVVAEDSAGNLSGYTTAEASTSPNSREKFDIANKTNLVGILYSTWHDYMNQKNGATYNATTKAYEGTIYNVPQGRYGSVGAYHYWSEPALGYYSNTDTNVIRTHMTQLADAGVDFIIIDNTNIVNAMCSDSVNDDCQWNNSSLAYYKMITQPVRVLLDTISAMRDEGLKTPYVVNWHNTNPENAGGMIDVFNTLFINNADMEYLKSLGFDKAKWADIWVYWNNKVFELTNTMDAPKDGKGVSYEWRKMWGLQTSVTSGEWSYLQKDNNYRLGTNFSGQFEQMSVSVAAQQTRMTNTSTALGRRGGLTFYEQWSKAFAKKPKIVTITWWNEWGAERIANTEAACGGVTYCFTDNYNQEYSRDIEPMKGGHGSTYLNWLKGYITAYKNNQSCPTNLHT